MDDEPDHLPPMGELKPWNVKDFPSTLRQRITHAAATQGVTVAEWLAAYFQKHGIDGEALPVIPVKANQLIPYQQPPSPRLQPVSELHELAQMARTLTPPDKRETAG